MPVEQHGLGGERLAGEVAAPLGRVVARVVVAEDAVRAVVQLLDLRLQDSIALRGELHGRLHTRRTRTARQCAHWRIAALSTFGSMCALSLSLSFR